MASGSARMATPTHNATKAQTLLHSVLRNIVSSTLFKNMASLGLLQMANYVIPILIIPFVVRALGTEYFGLASYAQNIVSYLTIFINYGFEYSATQDIALNRADHRRTCEIFSAVIRFKLLLLAASFLLLFILGLASPQISRDIPLYIFAALINIGFAIYPTWFFQGREEMEKMAVANLAVKLLGAALIVVFIRRSDDYRLYILLLSLSQIAVGIMSYVYVIRHYRLTFTPPGRTLMRHVIRKGFPIFLNNLFATLYTASGLTILGLYAPASEVGIYAGAHKIIMAVVTLSCMPLSLALFPMISRRFSESQSDGWKLYKRCLLLATLFGLAVSTVTYLAAPLAVRLLLGSEFAGAVPLLRLFAPLPFLVIMATMFTIQGLYGLQLQRFAPIVGGTVGTVCVLLNLILIPRYGMYSAAIGYMLAELLEILISASIIYIFAIRKQRKSRTLHSQK